jgi:hypothetical protein
MQNLELVTPVATRAKVLDKRVTTSTGILTKEVNCESRRELIQRIPLMCKRPQ